MRVSNRLCDCPANERLGRVIGLEKRQEADRADRLGEQPNEQCDDRNGGHELG